MIQIKVVESILSSLSWSIMSPNESSFIPARKKSESSVSILQEEDFLESNVDTNDDVDPENLDLNSKVILKSFISQESVSKKFSIRHFENSLSIESDLLGNFLKKGKTFEVSSKESLSKLKIVEPRSISQISSKIEVTITKEVVPLIIDRLKNDFQRPDNFVPRIRAHRNWKPLFLTWFHEIKPEDEDSVKVQRRISSSVPEKPRIYSMGLKYKFNTQDCESSQNVLKEKFTELLSLKSLEKEKIFQIEVFSPYKSYFPENFLTTKSGSTQIRSKETGIKSLNIKSAKSIEPKYRLVPLHQIAGVIKNDSKPRKRSRGKEKVRKSSWKSFDKIIDKKNVDFDSRKERTSSDEEVWKNSRRKHRSVKKHKSSENLKIISPTEKFDETIILCEDTLTEKLNQGLRQESMRKKNICVKDSDSSICTTELKKLDMQRNFEKMDHGNLRNDVESEILKNIKTRIDDDFEEGFPGQKKILNERRDFLLDDRNSQKPCNCRCRIDFYDGSKFSQLKKVKKLSKVVQSKKSLELLEKSLESDFENSSSLRKNLVSSSKSSKRNLIESVDSGVLTDFSLNDLRIEKNSCLKKRKWKRFPSFDSDSENSFSDDEGLSRKVEKVVKRFTEELILCERSIKARIKSKNMLMEDRDERIADFRRRRKFQKKMPRSLLVQRHTTSSEDFSKTSSLSSEEDFVLNISTPSVPSFTDSEYEKSTE